jgi:hypothetical protein
LRRIPEYSTHIVVSASWISLLREPDRMAKLASLEPLLAQFSSSRSVTLILNGPTGVEFGPALMFEGSRLTKVRPKNHPEAVPIHVIKTNNAPVIVWGPAPF